MTDCDKQCQYIADKIRINNMKSRAVDTKIHSPNKIVEYNELYQEHMNLLTDKLVCMDDCRRRNHDNERSSTSGSQDIPVDPALIAELKKLDSDYYDSEYYFSEYGTESPSEYNEDEVLYGEESESELEVEEEYII